MGADGAYSAVRRPVQTTQEGQEFACERRRFSALWLRLPGRPNHCLGP